MSKTLMKFSVSIELETENYKEELGDMSQEELGKLVAADIKKLIRDEDNVKVHHLYTEEYK